MRISNIRPAIAACIAIAAISTVARAQTLPLPLPPQPVVTVTASTTSTLANDRMHAWLRAETDNPDPAVAANEVNTRMAKALARAKAVRGIDASTTA